MTSLKLISRANGAAQLVQTDPRGLEIALHDGSRLTLGKLGREYDPSDRGAALAKLGESAAGGPFLTGLFYINTEKPDFTEVLHLEEEPLAALPPERARPSREALEEILGRLR